MVAAYLQSLQALLAQGKPRLAADVALECKHFFSGAAAYANGRIFMTLTPVGLALKLPEQDRRELLDGGASPLRYFATGPIKKDYVVVSDATLNDAAALARWIEKSVRFAAA